MSEDLFKKILQIFDIDEKELERQVATGFMIAGVAGLMYGAKKAKEVIEKKISAEDFKELQEQFKALALTANMILEKHQKLESSLNKPKANRPKAEIKVAKPPVKPPPVPKKKEDNEEGEQK